MDGKCNSQSFLTYLKMQFCLCSLGGSFDEQTEGGWGREHEPSGWGSVQGGGGQYRKKLLEIERCILRSSTRESTRMTPAKHPSKS